MPFPFEDEAKILASRAHATQRYGEHPYTKHLKDVAAILYYHEHYHLVAAAWLHDILEDTTVTESDLRASFPTRLVDPVVAVTGHGRNRKERWASVMPKLAESKNGRVLKLADRLANAKASQEDNPGLFAMYRKEWPSVRPHLMDADDVMLAKLDALFATESP